MVGLFEAEQETSEVQGALLGGIDKIEVPLLRWQHGRSVEGDARQRIDYLRIVSQVLRGELALLRIFFVVQPQHEGTASERAVRRTAKFWVGQRLLYVLPFCQQIHVLVVYRRNILYR